MQRKPCWRHLFPMLPLLLGVLLTACSLPAGQDDSFLAEDFATMGIRTIALLPIPYHINDDSEGGETPAERLRTRLIRHLEKKGYRVVVIEGAPSVAPDLRGLGPEDWSRLAALAPAEADAVLQASIDYYFVSLNHPIRSGENTVSLNGHALLLTKTPPTRLLQAEKITTLSDFGGGIIGRSNFATLNMAFEEAADKLLGRLPQR